MNVSDFGGYVAALATNGNDLYVGGSFYSAGGAPAAQGVARWDGTNWYALGSGLSSPDGPGDSAQVYALAVKDNTLYAGGYIALPVFVSAGVVKWDGTNWSLLGSGIPNVGSVRALAFKGNDLYASSETGLFKWDGTNWTFLGGANGRVYAFVFQGDDMYIGGEFTVAGGVPARNIAKWDGTKWHAFGSGVTNAASSEPSYVYSLFVQENDVLVSGLFTHAGGKPSKNFAIWHEMPSLNITYGAGSIQLSWSGSFTNYMLECNTNLANATWTGVSPPAVGNQHTVPGTSGCQFFRLRKL